MTNALIAEIIQSAQDSPDDWRWRWTNGIVTALTLASIKPGTEILLQPTGIIKVILHGTTISTDTHSEGTIEPALSWSEKRRLRAVFKLLVEEKLRRVILRKKEVL